MTHSLQYTRDNFIACEWQYNTLSEEHDGYFSVTQKLQQSAHKKSELGQKEQSVILELLSRSASMILVPNSLNEPFKPHYQNFQSGKRSPTPEDFTTCDLIFFEVILDAINEPWLKARVADLLWLCKQPKNPEHAKTAIESYTAHSIHAETWHRDINDCWERAARLCLQIKDFDQLNDIKNQLFAAFNIEHSNSKFISLSIASFMDELKIDHDFRKVIAPKLLKIGEELKREESFNVARPYFELAEKKFQQIGDEENRLNSLILIANCFELEADFRITNCHMAAHSFYENALQAYRRIPTKHRDNHGINKKITVILTKITSSGQVSLDAMSPVSTPGIDISEIIESSIKHVSGKSNAEEALLYFTGLASAPKYNELVASAKKNMQQSVLGSLVSCTYLSSDGRVVAKTPTRNINSNDDDPTNQKVLHGQIQQLFSIEAQLRVDGQILPALGQILIEYRITKELLEALCHHSPIVSQERKGLLGYALWLGFEYDFANAIHLLCPQLEHIVRIQLKEAGAHTTNIDTDGIENENGLSTLMKDPKAIQVFGEDLVCEIKSVFTDSLGFNLRNQVAHGLLDDNSSSAISTVYAWWMIIRLVMRSLINGNNN